jgi:hypothetical protein
MTSSARTRSELEQRLEVQHYLPRLRALALGVALIAAGALWAWPLWRSDRASWAGGPMSNHHRLIERDCARCHPSAFGGVPDVQCTACHAVRGHTELASRCASCHREHHEEDLLPQSSSLCAACHARIAELVPSTAQAAVADFASHPEFAVRAWVGNPPALRRVRIGEPGIRDGAALKFSHAGHLGLPAEVNGGAPLACASCHEASSDGKDLRPVAFARNCERCHSLAFDARLGGASAPHADADRVFAAIRSEVVRLDLRDGGRRLATELIDKESRDDESGLFTEGGACVMCHDVEARPDAGPEASRFHVRDPAHARWLPAARFEHHVHRLTACDQCHGGIKDSRSAGAVVLPSIAVCRRCHADRGTPGKVASPCLECHAYHPAASRR